MDLTKQMNLQDRMFWLCIIVAGSYCVFAVFCMYQSITLAGL